MKIGILTTQTPHHAFFVREIQSTFGDVVAFCETRNASQPPFTIHHPFEDDREEYEWNRWFGGDVTAIADLVPTRQILTMNEPEAVTSLEHEKAEVVLVFGTGILKPQVIATNPNRIFNLHGGDPESYRGLDTHLWAIFHREFSGLVTTLHRLDAGVDTGDIIVQGSLPLHAEMQIHQLRAANTEVCVRLAVAAIDMIARHGDVTSRPQRAVGRYYSAMPADLKSVCQSRFNAHIKKLHHAP